MPRTAFESEGAALTRRGMVPELHVLLEQDWLDNRNRDALPFGVALRLPDDFALISACEYDVGFFSVAAIEPCREGIEETTLRLEANESGPETV